MSDDPPEVSDRVLRSAYTQAQGDGRLVPHQGVWLVVLEVAVLIGLVAHARAAPAYQGIVVLTVTMLPAYVVLGVLAHRHAHFGRLRPVLVVVATWLIASGHASLIAMGKLPPADGVTEAMGTHLTFGAQFMLVVVWPALVCGLLAWLLRRIG